MTCRGSLVVGQGPHVEHRIVAAERELEAVLALGRAVAGSRVAAQAREHRHDVVNEVDARRGVSSPSTVTGTSTDLPASRSAKVALPSALGRTSPIA